MGYNRKNKLKQTIKVQEHFKKHYLPGMTIEFVYKTHIFPTFNISRSTFFKYMNVSAAKELQKILEDEENKPKFKQIAMDFDEPADATNNTASSS